MNLRRANNSSFILVVVATKSSLFVCQFYNNVKSKLQDLSSIKNLDSRFYKNERNFEEKLTLFDMNLFSVKDIERCFWPQTIKKC